MDASDPHDEQTPPGEWLPDESAGAIEPIAPAPGADRNGEAGAETPHGYRVARHARSPIHARLTSLFEVLVCSDFPTQLFLAAVLSLFGLRATTPDHRYSATFVVTLSLLDAALLVSLIVWFLHLHGESVRDVLFARRPLWREIALGVALTPLVFLIAALVLGVLQQVAPSLHNVQQNPLASLMRTRTRAVLFAFVAVISGGVREEVQRGFILHRFEQHLGGGGLGLILFSVVFGAGHVIQGWDVAVTTAVLGAFWGLVYLIRRSVAAPMASHAAFDLAEIIRYTLYGS